MNAVAQEYTLEEIGRGRRSSISIKVRGYWSQEAITVYVRPEFYGEKVYIRPEFYGEKGKWSFQISHSSGGRDHNEVESDARAARYFAEGLYLAADIVGELQANLDTLNRFQADERDRMRVEFEQEQARKQAALEADTPLGMVAATQLVDALKSGLCKEIRIFNRGQERSSGSLTCIRRANVTLYIGGIRTSHKDAVARIAETSSRTHMV